jgi:hypothetical protein
MFNLSIYLKTYVRFMGRLWTCFARVDAKTWPQFELGCHPEIERSFDACAPVSGYQLQRRVERQPTDVSLGGASKMGCVLFGKPRDMRAITACVIP